MKLPEWDDQFVRWDRYKQFHMGLDQRLCATENYCWPPFIIFDDGEVICTISQLKPDLRRVYPELNVELAISGEQALYLPDGTQVPKAWLNENGQQYLIIDHDTHQVKQLLSGNVPRGTARFTNKGEMHAGQIKLCRPFKTHTKEMQEQITEFILVARAAMTLMDHPCTRVERVKASWSALGYYEHPKPTGKLALERILEVASWEELNDAELRRFWFAGVDARNKAPVDYLLTVQP
jgi:hypothetical protein